MSNMPDVNKRILSVMIPRDLYHQLKQEAKSKKLELAVYIRMILSEAVIDTELSQDSLDKIRKEVENARKRRGQGNH